MTSVINHVWPSISVCQISTHFAWVTLTERYFLGDFDRAKANWANCSEALGWSCLCWTPQPVYWTSSSWMDLISHLRWSSASRTSSSSGFIPLPSYAQKSLLSKASTGCNSKTGPHKLCLQIHFFFPIICLSIPLYPHAFSLKNKTLYNSHVITITLWRVPDMILVCWHRHIGTTAV